MTDTEADQTYGGAEVSIFRVVTFWNQYYFLMNSK